VSWVAEGFLWICLSFELDSVRLRELALRFLCYTFLSARRSLRWTRSSGAVLLRLLYFELCFLAWPFSDLISYFRRLKSTEESAASSSSPLRRIRTFCCENPYVLVADSSWYSTTPVLVPYREFGLVSGSPVTLWLLASNILSRFWNELLLLVWLPCRCYRSLRLPNEPPVWCLETWASCCAIGGATSFLTKFCIWVLKSCESVLCFDW